MTLKPAVQASHLCPPGEVKTLHRNLMIPFVLFGASASVAAFALVPAAVADAGATRLLKAGSIQPGDLLPAAMAETDFPCTGMVAPEWNPVGVANSVDARSSIEYIATVEVPGVLTYLSGDDCQTGRIQSDATTDCVGAPANHARSGMYCGGEFATGSVAVCTMKQPAQPVQNPFTLHLYVGFDLDADGVLDGSDPVWGPMERDRHYRVANTDPDAAHGTSPLIALPVNGDGPFPDESVRTVIGCSAADSALVATLGP